MNRSPGSTEGFVSRFHRLKADAAAIETAQLSANTYCVPAAAMIAPASTGPTTREVLTATAFSASAEDNCERGTTSGRIAAYTGQRIASPMPLVKVSSSST